MSISDFFFSSASCLYLIERHFKDYKFNFLQYLNNIIFMLTWTTMKLSKGNDLYPLFKFVLSCIKLL